MQITQNLCALLVVDKFGARRILMNADYLESPTWIMIG